MLSNSVQWCLEKALERTLVADKEGSLDYLSMANIWQERTLVQTEEEDKLAKYFIEPTE